jgi:hypothetical protein
LYYIIIVAVIFLLWRGGLEMPNKSAEICVGMVESPGTPGFTRVEFNRSPVDDMRFKNGGVSLEEAMHAKGRRVTVCNAGILNEAW